MGIELDVVLLYLTIYLTLIMWKGINTGVGGGNDEIKDLLWG